jgi:hypothetical protein
MILVGPSHRALVVRMIGLLWRLASVVCLCLWFLQSTLLAEDVKLREEAVRLMERANEVSLPGSVPNYEQLVSFRVHYPDGSTKEGWYSRRAASAAGYREDETFDDASVLGRPAKCVLFDTQFGSTLQPNQLCMDPERGAMLRWQVGDETIENLDYFKVDNL